MDWSDYYNSAKVMGPNPFYGVLEPYLPDVPGRVVELGFGVGTGLGWWLNRGWSVLGVDEDELMCDHVRTHYGDRDRLEIVQSSFVGVEWGRVDVVCSVFALFFANRGEFEEAWGRIRRVVEAGGIFAGQLIGPGDGWADRATAVGREELDQMIYGLDVLHLEEVRRRGKTIYGEEKEWHVYHLILGG
jgi:SAM-dependent methyltransferase